MSKLPTTVSVIVNPRKIKFPFNLKGEVNIVKVEEVDYLKERIKLAVQTYEEKLNPMLFRDHEISMRGFINRIEEYF